MKALKILLLMVAWAWVASCAAPESRAAKGPMAEDLVCKYNGDLACVMVPISADTPSYEFKGRMYYFCSPTCKEDFIKSPEKYLRVAGK